MKFLNNTLVLSQTDESWMELYGHSRKSLSLYFRLLASDIPKYAFLQNQNLTVDQLREEIDNANEEQMISI